MFIQFSMFFPNLQRGGLQGQALGLCGELLLAWSTPAVGNVGNAGEMLVFNAHCVDVDIEL